jgi:O-antigen biosynthesis protein WbqP
MINNPKPKNMINNPELKTQNSKLKTDFNNPELKTQNSKLKTAFDRLLSLLLLAFFSLPMLCVALLVRLTSTGPVLYWSDRVGRCNAIFKMPKFRTMRVDTPAVATHLLADPDKFLTPIGKFLRKSSLDELPQLLSILRGDMSFVGPRPALYNQHDLVELRTQRGIHLLTPGLTGWAQINGRDELPIPVKVDFDAHYLVNRSFALDLKIIFLTFLKVAKSEGVTH